VCEKEKAREKKCDWRVVLVGWLVGLYRGLVVYPSQRDGRAMSRSGQVGHGRRQLQPVASKKPEPEPAEAKARLAGQAAGRGLWVGLVGCVGCDVGYGLRAMGSGRHCVDNVQ
jgi:hypothetical protein